MDAESVVAANDTILRNMGVCNKGDLLALRAFAEERCCKKNAETDRTKKERSR